MPRFGGDLTLLDSRAGGMGEGADDDGGVYDDGASRGNGARSGAARPAARGGKSDLDDDIPF